MKAITMYQPWASLLACGAKKYETRSWPTNYRGPIAIHAATRKPDTRGMSASTVHAMVQAVRPLVVQDARTTMYLPLELLPRGAIIATAELVECWQVIEHTPTVIILRQSNGIGEDKIPADAPYLQFGDYSVGRYIWAFTNMTMLPEPIPAKGRQRIWNWEGVTA